MADLERLTKAEIVTKLGGIPDDVLAVGRSVAALEPLVQRNWNGEIRSSARVETALKQIALSFGLAVMFPEEDYGL